MDETATLTISVSGLADAVDVPPPETRDGGLQFTFTGRRISMNSVNGRVTSSVEIDYLITPMRTGRHLIEPITGNVAGIAFTTNTQRLEVTDVGTGSGWKSQAQQAPSNPWGYNNSNSSSSWPPEPAFPEPREDDVLLDAEVAPDVVYKHQPIYYKLRLLTAVRLLSDPRYSPIAPTGFLRVPFTQENAEEERNGRLYSVMSVKTAYFPVNEGDYTFDSSQVSVSGGLFSLPQTLKTEAKPVKVLPWPSEGRPQSFTGAVGQEFEIRAHLKKPGISLGGNTELEVTVKGDGHLDLVPFPYLPEWAGLEKKQLSSPSSTSVENGQIVSRRTYNFRLKPTKVGSFELSGIALGYFNPAQERYEVVKTPPLKLQVEPNLNANPEAASGDSEVAQGDLPRDSAGPTQGRLPQTPWAALAMGACLLVAGALTAVPGRRSWWPGGRRRGKSLALGRCKTFPELMAALEALAPGADSATRRRHLENLGWNEARMAKLESLKRRAAQAVFGGAACDDGKLEELNRELADLLKESKR
jgi:hypothetical protein